MKKKQYLVSNSLHIQEALNKASKNGGIVKLEKGTYVVDNPLVITKPLTLKGSGSTIQGGNSGCVFDIKDEANVPDTVIQDCIIIPFKID